MAPRGNQSNPEPAHVTRRLFFGAAAGATSVLAADEEAAGQGTSGGARRTRPAYRVRVDTAQLERDTFQPNQTPNGDEEKFASKIGNFSKGLPHNALGEVDLNAYEIFRQAMIKIGVPRVSKYRGLTWFIHTSVSRGDFGTYPSTAIKLFQVFPLTGVLLDKLAECTPGIARRCSSISS